MSDDAPSEEMTLAEARAWLRARVDDGETCPCCTQFAKVYRRKVYGTMARTLIAMWRQGGTTDYLDVNEVRKRLGVNGGGDDTKMRYWNLLEGNPTHLALWRVTEAGEEFIQGTRAILMYAHVYDGRVLRYSGDTVNIREALGTKFNYDDLMQGV